MVRNIRNSGATWLLALTVALGILVALSPNTGEPQKLTIDWQIIDRQIVVMFKPNTVSLPEGQTRTSIDQATMPSHIRDVLQAYDAQEIAKGMPNFQKSDTLRILSDGRRVRAPEWTNLFVITLSSGAQRETLVQQLAGFPEVLSAEKNQKVIFRETTPDDTYFATRQWNLKNSGQFGGTLGADIKATFAWDLTTGSSLEKLGIVDSGIEASHLDLGGKVTGDAGWIDDHGTHVAGIAGAVGFNGQGIAGIDWSARLHSEVGWDMPTLAEAVWQASVSGARVINNSWGFENYSPTLESAFILAYQADALPIVANPETGATGEFPNALGTYILNVGATTNTDGKASYSFARKYTDVAAPGGNAEINFPGRNIWSTVPNPINYDYKAGTSMAAPHVTGIAGLLRALNPNLHNYDLEWVIKRTADDKGNPGPDREFGYGRVNAYEAAQRVVTPYTIAHGDVTTWTKIHDNVAITFLETPLPGRLAAGVYYGDRWKMEAVANFSPAYSEVPWVWLSQTGYSGANPNTSDEFMFDNTSTSSTTVMSFFYYLEFNDIGQPVNLWVPHDPNQFSMQYAVLGIPGAAPKPAVLTEVQENADVPAALVLEQNHPNPFNPVTQIRFGLPQGQRVRIDIYNVQGQRVRRLVDMDYPAGYHAVGWDSLDDTGKRVASGQYFYRLAVGEVTQTRKMLLLK